MALVNRTKTLIVCLGSAHGDDRIGWVLADRLAGRAGLAAEIRKPNNPLRLLDWLDQCDRLIICDASQPAGSPGRIRRWTWPSEEIKQHHSIGSHDFHVASVLQLAQQLHQLPPHVVIFSIEARSTHPGDGLSAEVEAALPQLLCKIETEIES